MAHRSGRPRPKRAPAGNFKPDAALDASAQFAALRLRVMALVGDRVTLEAREAIVSCFERIAPAYTHLRSSFRPGLRLFFLHLLAQGAQPGSEGLSSHALAKATGLKAEELAVLVTEEEDRWRELGSEGLVPVPDPEDPRAMEFWLTHKPPVPAPDLDGIFAAATEFASRVNEANLLGLRHLFAAFLFWPTDDRPLCSHLDLEPLGISSEKLLVGFRRHLENASSGPSGSASDSAIGDRDGAWVNAIRMVNALTQGRKSQFIRDALDTESVLEVKKYAKILGILMREADEQEFSLAIFGHWGRGKTFLMKHLAACLRTPPPALGERRRRARTGFMRHFLPVGERPFETVTFKAWRYPSKPEVWIHLYETVAQAAFGGPWYKTLPNIIRSGIEKRGWFQLLAAYAALAFGVTPWLHRAQAEWNLIRGLYVMIGLMGLIWLYTFIGGIRKATARLSAEYLTATRHTEKLGLQATIGSDLEAALKGWVRPSAFSWWFYLGFALCTLWLLMGTWWRLTTLENAKAWFNTTAAPFLQHQFGLTWNLPSPSVPVPVLLLSVVAVVVALLLWIRWGGSRPDRLLLVVDDLDRCSPDHLLSVMESIKLLLENPEVSCRVVVSMLVEEDILKHAIWEKYKHLAEETAAKQLSTSFSGEGLFRQNCEKLFTVHLRMEPLDPNEIQTIIESFSREERLYVDGGVRELPVRVGGSPVPRRRGPNGTPQPPTVPRLVFEGNTSYDFYASTVPDTLVLGAEERAVISDVLTRHRVGSRIIAPLGPRAIRAFIFRYQLARLLLRDIHHLHVPPRLLAEELADRLYLTNPNEAATVRLDRPPQLTAVVKQVS
jgi:hypothetical protein